MPHLVSYIHSHMYTCTYVSIVCSQVDPTVKSPKNRVLYDTLESLVAAQEQTCTNARASEQEVSS